MTTLTFEGKTYSYHDDFLNVDQVKNQIDQSYESFNKIVKSYLLFNVMFLVAGILELSALLLFLSQTIFAATLLALIFLTAFSYFILRFYFQAKKLEQFEELTIQYLKVFSEAIGYQPGVLEHHVALANACCKFASHFQGKEYSYFSFFKKIKPLQFLAEKASCWWHWKDIQLMQEYLLTASIEEHIKMVKCEPTSLEIHAALANAYVMLSSLYIDPKKIDEHYVTDRWVPKEKYSKEYEEKFKFAAKRAIEEFKVLSDFAPNDPWVHMQLAYSYRDLGMPQEEIKQYEIVLNLVPNDPETLFKLGKLYFEHGQNANGLRLYEKLKNFSYKKAEHLIKFYGQ